MKKKKNRAYKPITKDESINIRVTVELKAALTREAAEHGESLSEYVCELLIQRGR